MLIHTLLELGQLSLCSEEIGRTIRQVYRQITTEPLSETILPK